MTSNDAPVTGVHVKLPAVSASGWIMAQRINDLITIVVDREGRQETVSITLESGAALAKALTPASDVVAPVTGATDEQIVAALRRGTDRPVDVDTLRGLVRITIDKAAALLVPPGMVIAPASDVITPELRAAIGRVLDWYWDDDETPSYLPQEVYAAVYVLNAAANGGAL